jgi:hypothetical protein
LGRSGRDTNFIPYFENTENKCRFFRDASRFFCFKICPKIKFQYFIVEVRYLVKSVGHVKPAPYGKGIKALSFETYKQFERSPIL